MGAGYSGSVTVALVDLSTGATLGGTLTAAADDGVATFRPDVNLAGSYALSNNRHGYQCGDDKRPCRSPVAATQLIVARRRTCLTAGLRPMPWPKTPMEISTRLSAAVWPSPSQATLAVRFDRHARGDRHGRDGLFPGLGAQRACPLVVRSRRPPRDWPREVASLQRNGRPVRGNDAAATERCCRRWLGLTVAAEDGRR